MRKQPTIQEGGVFVVPISKREGVCLQVWTVSRTKDLAHCGISRISISDRTIPKSVDWSDATLYIGEANVILDDEWSTGRFDVLLGCRPAKAPMRDDESLPFRILYDLFKWRPDISKFELPEQIAARAIALLRALKDPIERKAAQPGATDNPGNAQRVREG